MVFACDIKKWKYKSYTILTPISHEKGQKDSINIDYTRFCRDIDSSVFQKKDTLAQSKKKKKQEKKDKNLSALSTKREKFCESRNI